MSAPDVLPPSPPTTNHRHRNSIPLAFKISMSTPDDSPASFPPSSGAGNRKRVDFSPWSNVVDPLSSTPTTETPALKVLPPSRQCHTNTKSILKPFTEPVVPATGSESTEDEPTLLPEILETVARQLGNNNKGSSLDAYQTLAQVIKAYDEIPEDVNTRSCIATVLRCIRRDLSTLDQTQSSPIDTNLMTQALKVSVILVWSEHFSPLLTDEFRVFIIDRSINALAEHTAPKVIIIHYMHLLAMQNFRPGILSTNNRTVKLLEALQDITNHVQGKGAVAERLLIYQKLIEQAKSIMKARVSLWIKEVFSGLSSSVKDIRDKAVSVSARACAAFPCSPTVSAAAREALATTISDRAGNNRTLSSILTQRLEKMVAAKDEAVQVPQIWALAMLLCNSTDARLESWNILREWLKVIQRCFNCSDTSVKSQAFPAWNRFIYICRPHEASETILSMLAKPIIAQIERTSANTTGKGLRPAAVSSYYMLLYYAFRPAASHKQYTRMWNEYIVKIVGNQFLSRSTANADMCSRILASLMWKESAASRIWNENRAHENMLLEPEELPTVDCKWIRANTEAILQIQRLLFRHSVWGPSVQHSDQAFVAKAWRNFLRAIRESASKEIKPSAETRRALSHVINFIQDISDSAGVVASSCGRSQLVCGIAIAELGSLCLIEALESDCEIRCPMILSELLRTTMAPSMGPQTMHPHKKDQSFSTSLSNNLQRCLRLLNQSLQRCYGCDDHELKPILNMTSVFLRALKPEKALESLILLQNGLALVIEDKRNLGKLGSDSSSLLTQWIDFSETVVDCVTKVPASQYHQLDDLLAALLLSCNVFTRNSILKAWAESQPQEEAALYGARLLNAIDQTRDYAEINLPGIQSMIEEQTSQVRRQFHVDSAVVEPHNSHAESFDWSAEKETAIHEIASIAKPSSDGKTVSSLEQLGPLVRGHHNDSQIDFVRVDGLPTCTDEVESQLLTERQKEVRARQYTEQVVTFPDLRSSPRPRSAHESRAASVDCEMARKVAAANNLPSTPTLNRQNDNMEDDELPSPTPKARKISFGNIDVEIPSSPPSAVGNRYTNISRPEELSSPPKIQNDPDVDIVLDDIGLLGEQNVIGDDGPVGEDPVQDPVTDAPARAETIALPVADNYTVESNLETTVTPLDLRSTVQETVPESGAKDLSSGRHPPKLLSVEENDSLSEADDIDELSASQLSQSLDSYIADEVQNSFAYTDPVQGGSKTQKRRKRATSGYADQDRKKRRRRIVSKGNYNQLEIASVGSFDHAEPVRQGSCTNVVNAELQAPEGDELPKDSIMDGSRPASPTRLAGERHQNGRPSITSTPVHVKTQNTNTKGDSNDNPKLDAFRPQATPEKMVMRLAQKNVESGSSVYNTGPETISERTSSEEYHKLLGTDEAIEHSHNQTDITTALQMALDGLKQMHNKDQRAGIDLKAIDDLCFKIRYQAQELARAKK